MPPSSAYIRGARVEDPLSRVDLLSMTSADPVLLITGASSGIGAATARAASPPATASRWPPAATTSSRRWRARRDGDRGPLRRHRMGRHAGDGRDDARRVRPARRGLRQRRLRRQARVQGGPPEHWKAMVLTNVYGAAITVRATMPRAAARPLLLTSSVAGRRALPGSLYSATKWAVTAMGEALRQELNDTGVRVTLIEPGMVDTPFFDNTPTGCAAGRRHRPRRHVRLVPAGACRRQRDADQADGSTDVRDVWGRGAAHALRLHRGRRDRALAVRAAVLPAPPSACATGGRRRPLGVVLGLDVTFRVTIVGRAEVVDGVGLGDDATGELAVARPAGLRRRARCARWPTASRPALRALIRTGPRRPATASSAASVVGAALGLRVRAVRRPDPRRRVTVGAASGRRSRSAPPTRRLGLALLALALGGRRSRSGG